MEQECGRACEGWDRADGGGLGQLVFDLSLDMFIFECMVLDSTYLNKLMLNLDSPSNKC